MSKEIKMRVTAELAVNVLPSVEHEFLMMTKEVAHGYGTSEYAIRVSKMRHENELIEGKHYFVAGDFAVTKSNGTFKIPRNAILWTKRGVIRLGFFIKSERARSFRDWAEDLVIKVEEQATLFSQPEPQTLLPAPQPRKHNRLTSERLLDIMADVVKIEDAYLRHRITKKLGL